MSWDWVLGNPQRKRMAFAFSRAVHCLYLYDVWPFEQIRNSLHDAMAARVFAEIEREAIAKIRAGRTA